MRSLFEKTGVASLRELVERIFVDDYLPQLARRMPLFSHDGFAASVRADRGAPVSHSEGRSDPFCREWMLTHSRAQLPTDAATAVADARRT